MNNPIVFITLIGIAIPVWLYGAINQRRMNRQRRPPRLRINPFSADGLTAEGLVYRRRSLRAFVVFVLLGVLAFVIGP